MYGLLSVGTDNKNTHVKLCTSLAFLMLRCNKEVCFLRTPCVQVWHWMLLISWGGYWSGPRGLSAASQWSQETNFEVRILLFTVRAGSDS